MKKKLNIHDKGFKHAWPPLIKIDETEGEGRKVI